MNIYCSRWHLNQSQTQKYIANCRASISRQKADARWSETTVGMKHTEGKQINFHVEKRFTC